MAKGKYSKSSRFRQAKNSKPLYDAFCLRMEAAEKRKQFFIARARARSNAKY